jgi:hypothetical protein
LRDELDEDLEWEKDWQGRVRQGRVRQGRVRQLRINPMEN